MASTYSTNLAIELIGTGDQAGTWGNTTNTNLGTLIEQAISGYVTQAVSTGTDTTITIPNGATGVARNMYIELTGTGGASTNLIVPANKKLYFIFNNTSSGQVTVKVSGQTGISVPNKAKMVLVSNGTDIVDATNYMSNISAASANITVLTSASATITNLIATSASITTLTNNPTFSGGTANGVLYLNGSKVATSGSALTFDGSRLITGYTASVGTAYQPNVQVKGSSASNYGAYGVISSNNELLGMMSVYSNGENSLWLSADPDNLRTGSRIVFAVDATDRMTLDSTGLGIGTSSPGQKLEVAGNILINTSGNPYMEVKTSGAGNNPYLKLTADTNSWTFQGTFSNTNDDLLVLYNASTLLDLTKDGNLGLGVTPSAWSTSGSYAALQIGAVGLYGRAAATNELYLTSNAFNSATGFKYIYTASATRYDQDTGKHIWYNAPSGTAGNTITFTQAMTLDASGNLGVGTTSPAFDDGTGIQVSRSGTATYRATNTSNSVSLEMKATNSLVAVSSRGNYPLILETNGTERARITSGGDFLVGTTTGGADGKAVVVYNGSGAARLALRNNTTGDAAGDGFQLAVSGSTAYIEQRENADLIITTNNTERASITASGDLRLNITALKDSKLEWYQPSTAQVEGVIYTNGTPELIAQCDGSGGVKLTSGATSWASASDIRNKDIIEPIENALVKINKLSSVIYKFKDDEAQLRRAGLIAQEVNEVLPEAVYIPKKDDDMWGVRYPELVPLLVAAIKEQTVMINDLKAKVAALESK